MPHGLRRGPIYPDGVFCQRLPGGSPVCPTLSDGPGRADACVSLGVVGAAPRTQQPAPNACCLCRIFSKPDSSCFLTRPLHLSLLCREGDRQLPLSYTRSVVGSTHHPPRKALRPVSRGARLSLEPQCCLGELLLFLPFLLLNICFSV